MVSLNHNVPHLLRVSIYIYRCVYMHALSAVYNIHISQTSNLHFAGLTEEESRELLAQRLSINRVELPPQADHVMKYCRFVL